MKAKEILFIGLVLLAISSCKIGSGNKSSDSLDAFCSIKPTNWNCKVVQNQFDTIPILEGLDNPLAIVSFSGNSIGNNLKTSSSESVFLYVYDISKKDTLEKIIAESMKYARCVPIFLGETKNYYVITSSCHVNTSFFTKKDNDVTNFKKLFTKFDENLLR